MPPKDTRTDDQLIEASLRYDLGELAKKAAQDDVTQGTLRKLAAYEHLESEFMFRGVERFSPRLLSWNDIQRCAPMVLESFGDVGKRENVEDVARGIRETALLAVERLGLDALWSTRGERWERVESLKLHRKLNAIREQTRSAMERLYDEARRDLRADRQKWAHQQLLKLGGILAGDLRGVRDKAVRNPAVAYAMYRQRLFRLKGAERMLRGMTGNRATRLRRMAAARDVPERYVRFLGLPKGDVAHRSPEAVARDWTAERLGVSEPTVRSLIARGGRRRYVR